MRATYIVALFLLISACASKTVTPVSEDEYYCSCGDDDDGPAFVFVEPQSGQLFIARPLKITFQPKYSQAL